MSLPSLYVLADQYLADADTLADLDLDQQTIADTLEGMGGDLELKATNVAMFIQSLNVTSAAIKEAEAKMATRRKAIDSRIEQITEYLLTNMQRCGYTKIDHPMLRLSIQNNPPSVVIDDAGKIPCELYKYPPAPEPYPDKVAIKERLKAGEFIDGVHLEVKQRLVIK